MRADDLKALQAPFKQRYRDEPEAALITLKDLTGATLFTQELAPEG
jgi:hypothetical protein